MKRFTFMRILLLVIFVMFISAQAYAGDRPTYNTTNQGGQGGNATATGITGGTFGGEGGEGGSATIEEGAVKVDQKQKQDQDQKQKQHQQQKQGQIQGQLQGQTAHNEGVHQTTIFNEAETKREHIGGSASYAQAGAYGGKYEKGAEYLSADIITAVKKTFEFDAALEDYGRKFGKGMCETTGHSYNGRHEDNPTLEIDVYTLTTIQKLDKKFKVIGFLTIKSVKEGTDSFMVMQKGVLSAGLMRGDAFVVTSEGATFKPKSSGWGIGTFFSGGQVADHGGRGDATAAGGGTGFSKTKSELLTFPWMTIQVLQYVD